VSDPFGGALTSASATFGMSSTVGASLAGSAAYQLEHNTVEEFQVSCDDAGSSPTQLYQWQMRVSNDYNVMTLKTGKFACSTTTNTPPRCAPVDCKNDACYTCISDDDGYGW
jgi:hypothetical protein